MKPGKGQFDTDSLQKMGAALGWHRETVKDAPLKYSSEEGFSGGPGGTYAVNSKTDEAFEVGAANVKVKRKSPTPAQLAEKYRK